MPSSSNKKNASPGVAPGKLAAPGDGVAEVDYDPNEERRVLRQLLARYGMVSDEHREAYDSLSTAARRSALGTKTRAPGVLRDGVAWAVEIDRSMTRYPVLVKEHYPEARFSYLLDRLLELDEAIEGQSAERGGTGARRGTAEEREKAARDARRVLVAKLVGVAGDRETEKRALDGAMGTQESTAKLGKSIQDLVHLGRSWLALEDGKSKLLCASAGLTERILNAALAAGEALTGAATDATLAGKRSGFDSPEVNLIEGWVLQEMAEAQRCFDEARATTNVVPRLIALPSTRHVLGARRGSSKPDAGDSSPPVNGAPPA